MVTGACSAQQHAHDTVAARPVPPRVATPSRTSVTEDFDSFCIRARCPEWRVPTDQCHAFCADWSLARRHILHPLGPYYAAVRHGIAPAMHVEAIKCAERTLPPRPARFRCRRTSIDLLLTPTGGVAWASLGSFEPECEAFADCLASSISRVRHSVRIAPNERMIVRAPPFPLTWWPDPAVPSSARGVW